MWAEEEPARFMGRPLQVYSFYQTLIKVFGRTFFPYPGAGEPTGGIECMRSVETVFRIFYGLSESSEKTFFALLIPIF